MMTATSEGWEHFDDRLAEMFNTLFPIRGSAVMGAGVAAIKEAARVTGTEYEIVTAEDDGVKVVH